MLFVAVHSTERRSVNRNALVPDNTVLVGIVIVIDNNFKLQHVPLPLFLLDRPDVLGGAGKSGSMLDDNTMKLNATSVM
jgi:hypothetical protein